MWWHPRQNRVTRKETKMSKFFVTLRIEFDDLGKLNLNVGNDLFGYNTVSPYTLKATKKHNPITVVDFSPEFESVKASVGNTLWINPKVAEPKIAAKRGKAKAKAEAKVEASPKAEPEITKEMILALLAKMS
jgi:hypothetical protein